LPSLFGSKENGFTDFVTLKSLLILYVLAQAVDVEALTWLLEAVELVFLFLRVLSETFIPPDSLPGVLGTRMKQGDWLIVL
jgi:hypothetical protein